MIFSILFIVISKYISQVQFIKLIIVYRIWFAWRLSQRKTFKLHYQNDESNCGFCPINLFPLYNISVNLALWRWGTADIYSLLSSKLLEKVIQSYYIRRRDWKQLLKSCVRRICNYQSIQTAYLFCKGREQTVGPSGMCCRLIAAGLWSECSWLWKK